MQEYTKRVWFRFEKDFSDYTEVLSLALKWKEKGFTVYEFELKTKL